MKLSEAMMLGSTTCKMIPGDWNSCALGCAGNAVSIPQGVGLACLIGADSDGPIYRNRLIYDAFPWLLECTPEGSWSGIVWYIFDNQVCLGKVTFEQLVDYVASVEPECGECNRFECTCRPTLFEAEAEAEARAETVNAQA